MALLSKSSILSGLQCHKRLHLQRNRKELGAEDSGQKLSAIRNGIQTGNLARQYFEGGVLVESNLTGDEREADWLKQTQKLMASDVPFIYEATFLSDDVLVRVDILERKGKVWNVYEVKASTSYKNKHVKDLAVQVKILRKAGLIIRKANLMLINPDYVFRGELDVRKMFYTKNMNKKIADVVPLLDNPISDLKNMLAGPEPTIAIGPHCNSPYECEFINHCWKDVPDESVLELTGSKNVAWMLWDEGIKEIKKIPEDWHTELSDAQLAQMKAVQANDFVIRKTELSDFLTDLNFPLHFLDFEAFNTPQPVIKGTTPYDQIPFQFSLHILEDELSHEEFLYTPGDGLDPREAMIEKLLQDLKGSGDILVYNLSFEKRILQSIAKSFKKYEADIQALLPRLKDLIIPFKERWVTHPDLKGKTSIKYVLPALVEEMSYSNLEIKNGAEASLAYVESLEKGHLEEELKTQLLAYCELDTLAMVKIYERFKEMVQ